LCAKKDKHQSHDAPYKTAFFTKHVHAPYF
jgi:hypothetical protein